MSYVIPEVSIERGLNALSMLLQRLLDTNVNDLQKTTFVFVSLR